MDDLDRVLLAEEPVEPSAGFVAAVMGEIRREAESPPLTFPWRPLLAGAVAPAALVALGALALPAAGLEAGGLERRLPEMIWLLAVSGLSAATALTPWALLRS